MNRLPPPVGSQQCFGPRRAVDADAIVYAEPCLKLRHQFRQRQVKGDRQFDKIPDCQTYFATFETVDILFGVIAKSRDFIARKARCNTMKAQQFAKFSVDIRDLGPHVTSSPSLVMT